MSGTTLGVDSPQIARQPGDVTVIEGGDAVFTVETAPANSPQYRWLRQLPGQREWEDLEHNAASYTAENVRLPQSGARYRCIVTDRVGGTTVTLYSQAASLYVAERPAPAKTVSWEIMNRYETGSKSNTVWCKLLTTGIPTGTEIALLDGQEAGIAIVEGEDETTDVQTTDLHLSVPQDTEPGIYPLRVMADGITSNVSHLIVEPAAGIYGVTVTPGELTVNKGGEATRFQALVDSVGSVSYTVQWTVVGQGVNTNTEISADGVLTVGYEEYGKTLTVTATVTDNFSQDMFTGTATVTLENTQVYDPELLSLDLLPKTAVVRRGQDQRFKTVLAFRGVRNPDNLYYTLEGDPTDPETVFKGDRLNIGPNETAKQLTIRVIADPSGLSAAAVVTVPQAEMPGPTVSGVTVSPGTAEARAGETVQFSAEVEHEGSVDTAVTWFVAGSRSDGTAIGAGGLLTISELETADTLRVTAFSNSNPDLKDTAGVSVTAVVPVDKSALEAALDEAAGPLANKSDYTAASLKELEGRSAAAQGVYDDADATQTQVDEAAEALAFAYDALRRVYPVRTPFREFDGGGTCTAIIEAPREKFSDLVCAEGTRTLFTVDPDQYTVGSFSPGANLSTITLQEEFLLTLPNGVYAFTANCTDGEARLVLTVKDSSVILVTGISITGGSTITRKGGTLQLAAEIAPKNASRPGVTWSVAGGAAYAAVDQTGLVTAKADGTAIIQATAQDGSGVSDTHTVTITGQSGSGSSGGDGGGGGSGGGGGGTPLPPRTGDRTVIDEKTGDQLIEDARDNEKETIIIGADTPLVSLPAGFLAKAQGETRADILISTPVASIRLPNGALGNLASLGGEITVQAILEKNDAGNTVLTLDITANKKAVAEVLGGVKVAVPFTGGSANTVAILRGSGKVLPKSIALNGRMTVTLSDPTSVLLTDNSKAFYRYRRPLGRGVHRLRHLSRIVPGNGGRRLYAQRAHDPGHAVDRTGPAGGRGARHGFRPVVSSGQGLGQGAWHLRRNRPGWQDQSGTAGRHALAQCPAGRHGCERRRRHQPSLLYGRS